TDYFETIAKHENAIIELAIATAEKITKQHLAESITGMAEMVKDAIDDLQKRSNISLFVSPNDYEHVLSRKEELEALDRKSTRLNSSHVSISYAVFCLKTKK